MLLVHPAETTVKLQLSAQTFAATQVVALDHCSTMHTHAQKQANKRIPAAQTGTNTKAHTWTKQLRCCCRKAASPQPLLHLHMYRMQTNKHKQSKCTNTQQRQPGPCSCVAAATKKLPFSHCRITPISWQQQPSSSQRTWTLRCELFTSNCITSRTAGSQACRQSKRKQACRH
jgi:hypothetical protein